MSECEISSVATGLPDSGGKVAGVDKNRAVRNVQTQHGDYRTVDEENIVVLPLARCHSPEPVVDESGEIEPVVIIEPFAEENQVSCCFTRGSFDSVKGSFLALPWTLKGNIVRDEESLNRFQESTI